MQAGSLPLTLATGWKNAPPRAIGRRLIWKDQGHWRISDTDFAQPVDLGQACPVDCPPAFDAARGYIYRYHCAQWGEQRDASEFRQIEPDGQGDERIFALGNNKWALWLCAYLPAMDKLAALVATEMPSRADGTVVIQHQLGMFDLARRRSLLVNLPRDCFFPLDIASAPERLLFHGGEGFQVVDFAGRRVWRLGPKGLPEGRGGAFHPHNADQIALGGGGVVLIDRSGKFSTVRERGLNPVWAPDGESLYFAESSSDLWCRAPNGDCERLLSVAGNRYSEVNRARPARFTADGRYLAIPLTRRIRRQPLEGALGGDNAPAWAEWQAICILDLAEKEVWQTSGGGPICWAE
ncbi:hypothetical protein [Cerasicoccus arenae]|uniref:Uncharacterized protein n=2 Tax=Cerasicoccus arenae TaxID=424488 RepID=A0A8J3GCD2_9BACT|nr:hypothetical protein [Cerasicoccus arenae]MBK1857974.1 hypothetical protein [Cerasicoccus arenae]GHB97728.1 hypothetical protein GCM10007047_11990 [Cerasicoccus arenae]